MSAERMSDGVPCNIDGKTGGNMDIDDDTPYIDDVDGEDPTITVFDEGGYGRMDVSVLEVLAWVRRRRPDLLQGSNE